MSRVLYIHAGLTQNQQFAVQAQWQRINHAAHRSYEAPEQPLIMVRATRGIKTFTGKKKKTWHADLAKRPLFDRVFDSYTPDLCVIADEAALALITDNRYKSLDTARGSVYMYNDVPCIIADKFTTMKQKLHGSWAMGQDFAKAFRWLNGKQRKQAPFAFEVTHSVRILTDFVELVESYGKFLALDCETSGNGERCFITALSYSCLLEDGGVVTRVVPIFDVDGPEYCAFHEQELQQIFALLRRLHDTDLPKVMQNGLYDAHYFIRHRIPLRNFICDTAVIMHSRWPEAPKRIDFIASLFCDYYSYWKDQHSEEKDDVDKGAIKVPTTTREQIAYWEYAALDAYFTLMIAIPMLVLMTRPGSEWHMSNNIRTTRQVLGPALAMSMRGMKVNQHMQSALTKFWEKQSNEARERITIAASNDPIDAPFNPNSPPQVATLLYDIYGAKPIPRKGKGTDEKILKLLQTQDWLVSWLIDAIWKAKKPANNRAKYGTRATREDGKPTGLKLWDGRLYYLMKPTGTTMWRYASSQSNFWTGTQVQNIPYQARCILEPDPGYFLIAADYSASDNWFTAFQSGDLAMINAVTGDRDTHCLHAAQFFQRDYDEIYAGYKNKEDWVVDSIKGVRQITKRVVYGANYLMMAFTLYITMGKIAVEAAAKQLGQWEPTWALKDYLEFCAYLLNYYHDTMYPGMKAWLEQEAANLSRNKKVVEICSGYHRFFFGDPTTNDSAMREFASCFGQAGTAGNMNLALDNLYYGDFEKHGGELRMQVHDDIIAQVPIKRHAELVPLFVEAMQNSFEAKGRSFTVPAEPTIGLGWGYRMMDWREDLTFEDVLTHDQQWQKKWYAEHATET